MKKKLIFTAIIWLILFTILELGLRAYYFAKEFSREEAKGTYNHASVFVSHPFAAYAANSDFRDHNSQGFRAKKDKVYAAASDAIKVVCLGGSSTYGTRVKREDCYPHQLELELAKATAKKVDVINAGLGGYSSANLISVLALRVIHLKPDVAIFYVGFNDAWNRLLFSGFKTDYSHAQKSWQMPDFPWWRHSRALDVTARLLGSPSVRNPHIHTVAWKDEGGDLESNWRNSSGNVFKKNLMTLIAIARIHAISPVFVTQATDFANHPFENGNEVWKRAIDEYTAIVEQVAEEMSVEIIDVRNLMTDRREYFADVLHMNEKGNKKRAEIIAHYLIENKIVKSEK